MRRAKAVNFSPKQEAARLAANMRAAAATMVEREERQCGSRMVAYEIVAQQTGASPSWLRKFLAGAAEAKVPSWVIGLNIIAAYQRACEHFEQKAENERAKARALQRQLNATLEGTLGLVGGASAEEAAGTAGEGIEGWPGRTNKKS